MNYTKEPGFIYIETPEDKAKYAPKLPTDEWGDIENTWRAVNGTGADTQFVPSFVYRRRLPASGWIELATAIPDKFPVLVTDGEKVAIADRRYEGAGSVATLHSMFESYRFDSRITHWMPCAEPPKPKQSPDEVAASQAAKEAGYVDAQGAHIFANGFLAGIAHGRGK